VLRYLSKHLGFIDNRDSLGHIATKKIHWDGEYIFGIKNQADDDHVQSIILYTFYKNGCLCYNKMFFFETFFIVWVTIVIYLFLLIIARK